MYQDSCGGDAASRCYPIGPNWATQFNMLRTHRHMHSLQDKRFTLPAESMVPAQRPLCLPT